MNSYSKISKIQNHSVFTLVAATETSSSILHVLSLNHTIVSKGVTVWIISVIILKEHTFLGLIPKTREMDLFPGGFT